MNEALETERLVSEPEFRAASFRELGKLLIQCGPNTEAKDLFSQALDDALEMGESGASTIADIAELYARLHEWCLARTFVARHCNADK